MPIDRFINERKNVWQRIEELLQLLDRMTLRKLHREEVRELGRIYRRTASDLAIARAESRDPRLINYLNSLVIRAHGRIYRADLNWAQIVMRVIRFFTEDFPRTFRRTWRYTLMAAIFFWLSFGISLGITMRDQDFSEIAGVPPMWRAQNTDAHRRWWLEAVRLIVGCALLLLVAATIEGFISPQPISPIIKISIGAMTGVALYSYLLLAGRGEAAASV